MGLLRCPYLLRFWLFFHSSFFILLYFIVAWSSLLAIFVSAGAGQRVAVSLGGVLWQQLLHCRTTSTSATTKSSLTRTTTTTISTLDLHPCSLPPQPTRRVSYCGCIISNFSRPLRGAWVDPHTPLVHWWLDGLLHFMLYRFKYVPILLLCTEVLGNTESVMHPLLPHTTQQKEYDSTITAG